MATSEKQIQANRLNSKKSTGAKTEQGRKNMSRNAVKHGLLSAETLLPWENGQDLADLSNRLTDALKPEGELEAIFVDRIISLTWRMRRAGRIETGIYVWRKYSLFFESALAEVRSFVKTSPLFDPCAGFSTETVVDHDKYVAAKKDLAERSIEVNSELPALGRTFVGDANTIATLNRYEVSLEKSLYKALHELQRIQAARLGQGGPLPIAIDIHGDDGA